MQRYDISGPYILWVDYGTEGWKPRSFDTAQEAIEEILTGACIGGEPVVLTKLLKVEVVEAKETA